jgi:hypothetical protein
MTSISPGIIIVANRTVKMKSLPLKFNLAKAKATRIEKNVPPIVVKNATKMVLNKYRLKSILP